MKSKLLAVGVVFAGLIWQSAPAQGAQENITVSNTSHSLGDGRWDWTVFVKAAAPVLAKIQCVEYTLDKSFPNPIRRVCTRGKDSQAFALSTNGWGTFVIRIRVMYRDKSEQQLQYNLQLQ
jgi:transcription initiation factor IIF auxiliary subunit